MADMTGTPFKDLFKRLLQLAGGANAGLTTTLKAVEDGEGNTSPLQLATDKVNIQSGLQLGGVAVTKDAAAINALARLDTVQTFTKPQAAGFVALTDAATIAVDLSLAQNFTLSLGGARTMGAPTGMAPGQSGVIRISPNTYALAWNAAWKWAGGAPTLSTGAGAVDLVGYFVESDNTVTAWMGVKGRA